MSLEPIFLGVTLIRTNALCPRHYDGVGITGAVFDSPGVRIFTLKNIKYIHISNTCIKFLRLLSILLC